MTAITASNILLQLRDNLTAKARIVYLYLAHRSNTYNTCFPGLKLIARECSISLSSVQRALRELLQKGLLKRQARYRENSSQTSNLYILAEEHEISTFQHENETKRELQEQQKKEKQMNFMQDDSRDEEADTEAEIKNGEEETSCFQHLTTPPSHNGYPKNLDKLISLQEKENMCSIAKRRKAGNERLCQPLKRSGSSWNSPKKRLEKLQQTVNRGQVIWTPFQHFTSILFKNKS